MEYGPQPNRHRIQHHELLFVCIGYSGPLTRTKTQFSIVALHTRTRSSFEVLASGWPPKLGQHVAKVGRARAAGPLTSVRPTAADVSPNQLTWRVFQVVGPFPDPRHRADDLTCRFSASGP